MAKTYSETEVKNWLAANLPSWSFEGGELTRTYTTGNWQLTLLLANAIGFLSEAAWHHPDLMLSYPRLVVRLRTHDANGITDKDFELAQRIEEIATWQPSSDAALDGRPDKWIT